MLSPTTKAQDAQILYASYCAGCHGASLDGNSATPLIKRTWIYGRGKGQLVRNITYGIAGTEMVSWKSVLSEDQIDALADYIIEAQATPISTTPPLPNRIRTDEYILKIEKVVKEELVAPWAIAFLNAQYAFITEREGHIHVLRNGILDPEPISGTPVPMQTPFGGFMGIALDPDYESNGWVYLSFSHTSQDPNDPGTPGMIKIVRGRISDHTWVDQEVIFQVPDSMHVANGHRWGAPLLFDREGYLYFTIGDLGEGEAAQDPGKAHGKTFRIWPDGTIPEDNPYAKTSAPFSAIYTLGNRNTQGLAQHPETGDIWSTDHGPMGGDELNILLNGQNYGWPVITYGIDYNGDIVSEKKSLQGMEQPVTYWTPSIATSEIEFVSSPLFGDWKNDLLVGALAYEEIRRLSLDGNTVINQEIMLKGYGRVRDIEFGPDGSLYVILNKPDMLIRITPEE